MKATDVDAVVDLARLALAFGRVDRITYHEDGVTPESDTDHTVMLGLVACAFAARHLPDLDLGRVAQYALVHDLVEVYAGDTPTLRISADQQAAKRQRERAALERIEGQFAGLLEDAASGLARVADQTWEQVRDGQPRPRAEVVRAEVAYQGRRYLAGRLLHPTHLIPSGGERP